MRKRSAGFAEELFVECLNVGILVRLAQRFGGVFGVEGLGTPFQKLFVAPVIGLPAAVDAAAGTGHDFDGVVGRSAGADLFDQPAGVTQPVCDADFAAIYDTKFIAALHPAAQLRTTSAISAAVAYCDDEPFAVVMPIKAEPETVRAVRAFFTEAAEDNTKTGEADKLRAELAQSQEEAAALRGDLYRAANEIDELKNKLAELHETKTEQPAAETVEPKTAAEIIAARWAEVDGLTATIKGATTAAPVVWLAGDTKPHEKEIEAAGGKWSGKKNAYYFRVA